MISPGTVRKSGIKTLLWIGVPVGSCPRPCIPACAWEAQIFHSRDMKRCCAETTRFAPAQAIT